MGRIRSGIAADSAGLQSNRFGKKRFYSFASVIGVGFLLLLIVNAWIAALG
jgi:hypothetical protein